MKKRLVFSLSILLILIILIWTIVHRVSVEKHPPILLKSASGLKTTEFQLHESVLFEATKLSPKTGYKVQIVREDGTIVTESILSTDGSGKIPETVIWYDIGILACPKASAGTTPTTHLSEHEIINFEDTNKNYVLKIMKDEKVVREMLLRVARDSTRPLLYAVDSRGCPKSGFLIGEEDVWVVGKNFPEGSLIRLWAVPNNKEWKDSDKLKDVTKQYNNRLPPIFELKAEETSFKKLLWPKGLTSIGSFDIVAEVVTYPFGSYRSSSTAKVQNVVSNLKYSGFVIQRRQGIGEPLEQDMAGVRMSKLVFRDTFLTTENVYVGVDPYVHPTYIGKTAKVYIVPHKTDAQWTVDTSLTDVTTVIETVTIQPGGCANCYSTLAWGAPLTTGEYDVVLDFDMDGKYTAGFDLIDSLDPVGFVVSEVRVDSISFNYSGSGNPTIYDNIDGFIINPPEYYSAGSIVKSAAWVMGGSHSVQVNLKAIPAVNSAQIWADGGLGGLNTSGSPVTVSFSGGTGQGTFNVNNIPTSIGKHLLDWDWKYKNVNSASTSTQNMGITGKHLVYTIYSTPKAPMTIPWLEVLEYATQWASNEIDEAGVVSKIVSAIYNSGMEYDGGVHHTTGSSTNYEYTKQFALSTLFNELRTAGYTVQMDCRDCANFFHVLTNALGFNHQFLFIQGPFDYNNLLPMKGTSCNSDRWNFHQVGWCGNHVADASAKLNCNQSAVCDMTGANYINLLTNTPNIVPGPTFVCSPY